MMKILAFVKTHSILSIIIVIAVVGGGLSAYSFARKGVVAGETFTVGRTTIADEVSVTGKVVPAMAANLSFETTGRVEKIYVKTGERVSAGKILVSLESSELAAQLKDAAAQIRAEQAKLDELRRGTRPEELVIAETKVESARIAQEDARRALADAIRDSFTKSDSAMRNTIEPLFANSKSSNPSFVFVIPNQQLRIEIERGQLEVEQVIALWRARIASMSDARDIEADTADTERNLSAVKSLLDGLALALSDLFPSAGLTQTTIDGHRTNVGTARAAVNTAISNVSAAREKWRSATSGLILAENELDLKRAGTAAEALAAQEARVAQAEARVSLFEAQREKTMIRAPFPGIVTRVEPKIGEIATTGTIAVSLISDARFEIEVYVPETDIARVANGNTARVTLDPYGDDTAFEAIVARIDPAETVVEGVSTYKTVLYFVGHDERIRSGMTANIDIVTARKENVLAIPTRFMTTRDGKQYVMRLNEDRAAVSVPIETGLKSSDGRIEIVSGIAENDHIIAEPR